MFSRLLRGPAIVFLITRSATLAPADEGMWLLNRPPAKMLKEKYGFEPTPAWLEHVQKSSVRFDSGGSASFVSADGLVMTNHHVGSDNLEKLSTPDKDLLKTGFYAATRDQELKCDDVELNMLWSIDDVTERVTGVAKPDLSPAAANAERQKMIAAIEKEEEEKSKLNCQVVTLFQGGRYHLYRYKRFTDVRLVFAPEHAVAFFGGDTDNFEYPRFNLDVCMFRVYENGQPYKPEHFLTWSAKGASENDLVFVTGHPGRTQRLYTVDHLKLLRDQEYPMRLERLWRREVQLNVFRARNDENARIGGSDFYGVQNSRKAITGMHAGLLDPDLMKRKIDAEHALRAAVDANAEYRAKWGDAWDQIASAEKTYRDFYVRRNVFARQGSELLNIAMDVVRLAEELPKPGGERLREYRDSELESRYLQLYSPAPIYPELESDRLASYLSYLAETFGGDDPLVMKALAGQSPIDRARSLVRGTKLIDVAERKRMVEGATAALAASEDPMIRFAQVLDPEARKYRKRWEDEVEGVERPSYAKIAAAKFAIEGEDAYPDATFTLRLAYGPVKGFNEGDRTIPPFTTYAGLYQRLEERKGQANFELPQRWLERKDKLDLSVPFNFICTADIIGGNSGSPVIAKNGEVVGLIFDGNIYSLVLDIAYTEKQARAVAVDVRGILEALRKIYDAGALVDELTRKP